MGGFKEWSVCLCIHGEVCRAIVLGAHETCETSGARFPPLHHHQWLIQKN